MGRKELRSQLYLKLEDQLVNGIFGYGEELNPDAGNRGFQELMDSGVIAGPDGKRIPGSKGATAEDRAKTLGEILRSGKKLYVYQKGEAFPHEVSYDKENGELNVSDVTLDKMTPLDRNQQKALKNAMDQKRIQRRLRFDRLLNRNGYQAVNKSKQDAYETFMTRLKEDLGYDDHLNKSGKEGLEALLQDGCIVDSKGNPLKGTENGTPAEHMEEIGKRLYQNQEALYVYKPGEKYPYEVYLDRDGSIKTSDKPINEMSTMIEEPSFFQRHNFSTWKNKQAFAYERMQNRIALMDKIDSPEHQEIRNRIEEKYASKPEPKPEPEKEKQPEAEPKPEVQPQPEAQQPQNQMQQLQADMIKQMQETIRLYQEQIQQLREQNAQIQEQIKQLREASKQQKPEMADQQIDADQPTEEIPEQKPEELITELKEIAPEKEQEEKLPDTEAKSNAPDQEGQAEGEKTEVEKAEVGIEFEAPAELQNVQPHDEQGIEVVGEGDSIEYNPTTGVYYRFDSTFMDPAEEYLHRYELRYGEKAPDGMEQAVYDRFTSVGPALQQENIEAQDRAKTGLRLAQEELQQQQELDRLQKEEKTLETQKEEQKKELQKNENGKIGPEQLVAMLREKSGQDVPEEVQKNIQKFYDKAEKARESLTEKCRTAKEAGTQVNGGSDVRDMVQFQELSNSIQNGSFGEKEMIVFSSPICERVEDEIAKKSASVSLYANRPMDADRIQKTLLDPEGLNRLSDGYHQEINAITGGMLADPKVMKKSVLQYEKTIQKQNQAQETRDYQRKMLSQRIIRDDKPTKGKQNVLQ